MRWMIEFGTSMVMSGVLTLSCGAKLNAADQNAWKNLISLGGTHWAKGDLSQDEKCYLAAIKEAEGFGDSDTRLLMTMNNLAEVYQQKNSYAVDESLHRRVTACYTRLM